MTSFRVGSLEVRIYDTREELGRAAALEVAGALRASLSNVRHVSAIFAAAPSQNETLAALGTSPAIDWPRVSAFHLDEYAGATEESSYSFRRYLIERLISKIGARFEGLRGESPDLPAECRRYASLLTASYPTIGLLGIGENGHLAFNDPPAARFDDPSQVRVVQLTGACRQQQVHDKTFPNLDAVPQAALTVTIPALLKVEQLFIMVPGERKAEAVRQTLEGPVTEDCPSSILRTHPRAKLFLERNSAMLLAH